MSEKNVEKPTRKVREPAKVQPSEVLQDEPFDIDDINAVKEEPNDDIELENIEPEQDKVLSGIDNTIEEKEIVKSEEEFKKKEEKDYITFSMNAKIFIEILNIIRCKGTDQDGKSLDMFESCIFEVASANRVCVKLIDKDDAIFLSMDIKSETFKTKGYEGNLIPVNIEALTKILKRFKSSDVKIVYNGEDLFIVRSKPRLVYKVEAINITNVESYVTDTFYFKLNEKAVPSMADGSSTLNCKIELKAEELKEILGDREWSGVKVLPFYVDVSKKLFVISVSSLNGGRTIEREIQTERISALDTNKKIFKSTYMYGIGNVLPNLSSKIVIYFNNDDYLYINKSTSLYRLDIMVAIAQLKEDDRIDIGAEGSNEEVSLETFDWDNL